MVNVRKPGRAAVVGVAGLLAVLTGGALGAEEITTVGVVDLTRVFDSFYTESASVRNWQARVEQFNQEREQLENEILELEQQMLEYQEEGQEQAALELEEELEDRRAFLDQFIRVRRRQLERERNELLEGDETFFAQLHRALTQVGNREGFTVIVDADSDGLLWHSDQVDVTDKVIDRLRN